MEMKQASSRQPSQIVQSMSNITSWRIGSCWGSIVQISNYNMTENQQKYIASELNISCSGQSEITKKAIEPQESFLCEMTHSHDQSRFTFSLPIFADFNLLLRLITDNFGNRLLHVERSAREVRMVFQGMKAEGVRGCMGYAIDLLLCCCYRKGMQYGPIAGASEVIAVLIRREERCLIMVTNPYHESPLHRRFRETYIDPLDRTLKKGVKSFTSLEENSWENPYLSVSSPTQLEIHIQKKIFHMFVLQEGKTGFPSFQQGFANSLLLIQEEFERYKSILANGQISKKKKPNPSMVMEKIVMESESLMDTVGDAFQDADRSETCYFYSLLEADAERSVSLYSLESALCFTQLLPLQQIYQESNKTQCEQFNRNCNNLNKTYSDKECFDYLQLKPRYRLLSQPNPYAASIFQLKKLPFCGSLRQMLLVIQKTFSLIKADCLVAHSGKVELSSMDDLLPVMIFVTLRACVHNFPLFVRIVNDYVKIKGVFELEQRVITTLEVAVEDITRKWGVKPI